MRVLIDFAGRAIRLTDERVRHIRYHPEMRGAEAKIAETVAKPDRVVESLSDGQVGLYYRRYEKTPVGAKFLCVVVKSIGSDAFVVTSYLTDTVKKGRLTWPEST